VGGGGGGGGGGGFVPLGAGGGGFVREGEPAPTLVTFTFFSEAF